MIILHEAPVSTASQIICASYVPLLYLNLLFPTTLVLEGLLLLVLFHTRDEFLIIPCRNL